jgi:hypothetical protein
MKYFLFGLTIFLLLLLQGGIINHLGLGAVGQILVVFTTIVVLMGQINEAWFTVLFSGLMLDFMSGTVDGTMVLCMLAVFFGTYVFVTKFISRELNQLTLIISIVGSTVVYSLALVIVNLLFSKLNIDQRLDYDFILGRKLLFDLITNLIFAYPILSLFNQLQRFKIKIAKTT